MSTPRVTNRSHQLVAGQKLIDGLKKHEPTLVSLAIDGKSLTVAGVIAVVQAQVDSASLVVSSKATWQANILADKAERAKNRTFNSGLVQALRVAFGNASVDVLADFGLVPHKPHPVRTPEEKAAATAKAKATRAARHTLGKRQRQAIKGTPQGAPATSPAAATGPTAPASTSPTAPAAAPAPTASHPSS